MKSFVLLAALAFVGGAAVAGPEAPQEEINVKGDVVNMEEQVTPEGEAPAAPAAK